jgi:hypothetical protein
MGNLIENSLLNHVGYELFAAHRRIKKVFHVSCQSILFETLCIAEKNVGQIQRKT